jgi:DNA invertase Pin-like site-specific DNA recombinase
MTTAFGYVRASTQEEVRQGSNERQKEILVNFFKARGWDYNIYEDKGKTGANMDRVGFKKLMDDIEKEKPYAVVVVKIDRYARSLIDLLNSIQDLEQKGIGFISVQDSGIDTTSPNGRLLLQILGAFAEFERNMINSRTSAGREKAMALGIKFGRPRYKTSEKNGGKYIDPKKVLELKAKGMSARSISKFMGCSITPVLKIIRGE